jgi:cell division protein FtsW (lipid II flippase)
MFSHVNARVDAWLHPFSDAEYNKAFGGSGQLVRGVFGLATGGLLGTGFGEGHPWFTPLANSDFIYSSIGEELGLAGSAGGVDAVSYFHCFRNDYCNEN